MAILLQIILLTYTNAFYLVIIFLANIVSMIVLTTKRMRSCFNTQLAALAGFDLLYLFITILIFGLPTLWEWYKQTIYPAILPVM